MTRTYYVADVETTGVRPTDKVVELAYIHINADLEVLAQDQSLIDPEIQIPSGASAVHHITNAMVECEPTIEEYMEMKGDPLAAANAVLIAHNAAFDFRYLGPWMADGADYLCTLRLAKKLYPGLDSYKLGALRYSLNLPDFEGDAHRADADVGMLLNLVQHMMVTSGLDLEELLALSKAPLNVDKLTFGKHKDKALKDVPKDYFQWLMKQDNVDPDLAASIRKIHPDL